MSERDTPSIPGSDDRGAPGSSHGDATQPSASGAHLAVLRTSAVRYELLDEIAQGGMGIVYRATDSALGREVAVKVLRDRFAPDSSAARRFVDEARIAGQLQHPCIPAIHDVGAGPDGRPFLAMKLIKGLTLDELLRSRPDPGADRGRFVAVFEQVCQAIAFAHAHQVIHRDLKPPNVMVGAFGEVQVMDWGLAKVLGANARATAAEDETLATEIRSLREFEGGETQAGSVLGTPAYMPPEQAAGAVDQIDERSDVFGLGAILAVILTGRPPFVADAAESTRVLAAQGRVQDCFGRLDASGAEPDLVALCKRCLSPEKADRPRDAGEVALAVAGLRARANERARQAELDRVRAEGDRARAEAEAREQRKRRRAQAALAVVLLAAVGLVAFGLWREDRRTARLARERAAARALASERLGASLDRAATAFRQGRPIEAGAALDRAGELLDPADAADLRGRYTDLRADEAAVAELDRIWARANTIVDDRAPGVNRRAGGSLRFDDDAARTGYPAAMAARGLDVGGDLSVAAARISGSAIRDRLIDALDDWLPVAAPADRRRLCDLLARSDPDPDRNGIRAAHAEPGRLPTVFARPPAEAALPVAARAAMSPAVPAAQALAVLRAAAARRPDDFRILYAAGIRMLRAEPSAAVGYFRAATGLRPDNLAAVNGLAFALHRSGGHEEAVPYYLRAIEIDSGFGSAYLNLADVIKMGADPAPAVAHFEREVGRDPRRAMSHFGLGMALRDHDPRRASAAFRESLEIDDTFAMAHNYLGYVLNGRAPADEVIRCYRRAIERDPTFAFPHYNVAEVLRVQKRDVPGAIVEYREALRLFPEHTFSHLALGQALGMQGDLRGAAMHLRRVIEINPKFLAAYRPLGRVLMRSGDVAGAVELYRECVRLFPTADAGYDDLIQALGRQGANAEGVRVYREAMLRADSTWPEEVRRRLRYNAACCAVLAGTGSGRDAPPEADRSIFRQHALDWLRAERLACEEDAGSGTAAAVAATHGFLKHWLDDGDLAPVREADAVGRLPRAEQDAWKQLWIDVRRLLEATTPSPRPTK
jgi:tetratricopeptide (TPR) repeat protein/tRNA A-37 threonylcarbamoyl transferase component Bud32